jgi:uncharacterized protein
VGTAPRRDGESAVQPPLPSTAGLLNSRAHLAVYVPRSRAIDHASILIHGRGGVHPRIDARLSHVGKEATVVYVYAVVVTVLNLAFWVGILFGLPGTWLMVLVTAVLKWWQPEYVQVSWTVLSAAGGLAVLGEVLEFALGAAGSRRAGGSIRAAALAIVGSLVGGIAGTALPVPIVGTLIGACVGAFAGSLLGDLWAGRPLFPSFEAGWGAAVGRFWGTISKLAIGAIIVLVLALAAFF